MWAVFVLLLAVTIAKAGPVLDEVRKLYALGQLCFDGVVDVENGEYPGLSRRASCLISNVVCRAVRVIEFIRSSSDHGFGGRRDIRNQDRGPLLWRYAYPLQWRRVNG